MKNHTGTNAGALITVRVTNGELYADSRDIAAGLNIEHRAFLATIDKHKEFIESEFGRVLFEKAPFQTSGGTQQVRHSLLTEDQSIYAATLSRNSPTVLRFKAVLVKAFRAARRALEQQAVPAPVPKFEIPTTLSGALRLAADLAEENQRITTNLHEMTEILEEAEPIVVAYDDFLSTGEGEYSWAAAAKAFDRDGQRMGRNRLLKILRDEGILFDGGKNHNTPKQRYVQYFRVSWDPEYPDTLTTSVRPEGMAFLSRLLEKVRERATPKPVTNRLPACPSQPPAFPAQKEAE